MFQYNAGAFYLPHTKEFKYIAFYCFNGSDGGSAYTCREKYKINNHLRRRHHHQAFCASVDVFH